MTGAAIADAPLPPPQTPDPAFAEPTATEAQPERVRITATRIRALASALAVAFEKTRRAERLAAELLVGREDDASAVAAAIEGIRLDLLNGDLNAAEVATARLLTEFGSFL